MKIVRIIGGLGNQMFQYAFYKRLKKEHASEDIYADTVLFKNYSLHNGLELERIFDIHLKTPSKNDVKKVSRYTESYTLSRIFRKLLPSKSTEYIEKQDFGYDEQAILKKGDFLYEGYWQNENYFKSFSEELKRDFSFRLPLSEVNKKFLWRILETNSVAVHVRRGDYLKLKLYRGICELEYYKKAIEYIKSKVQSPVFYIFSNDLSWCKENLLSVIGSDEIFFVAGNSGLNSYVDMQLMSNCKHNIIANSSFSWWAAWLNANSQKLVVAPKKWLNKSNIGKIQTENWILL